MIEEKRMYGSVIRRGGAREVWCRRGVVQDISVGSVDYGKW